MKNLSRVFFLSSLKTNFSQSARQAVKFGSKQGKQNALQFRSFHLNRVFNFSSNLGERDLKNLTSILNEHKEKQTIEQLYEIESKTNPIRFNLQNIDISLKQEFHKRLVDYYFKQRDLQTEQVDKNRCSALAIQELTELYYTYEDFEYKNEMMSTLNNLVEFFDQFKDNLVFKSAQTEFDSYIMIYQIFTSHQKDSQSFEVFKRLQENSSQEVKQANYEKYIESQCERVSLSQLARNHDQVFDHLDILFSETDKLLILKENQKLLNKLNQYFLRGILLSTQFDRPEKQIEYQNIQKKFVEKYDYQQSQIEKITLQIKDISEKNPNYLKIKGEQVIQFVENHKLEFSKSIQDVCLYQLFNQVVSLNLFEYFYMLVKFEANYREEIDEFPILMNESPNDLVDDFEEVVLINLQTILEIRKLILLFTKEVVEMQINDPYPKLEVSSWLPKIKPIYQQKIKKLFKSMNEQYI
ncbi:hypothetical protein ABPG72_012458 [Tetrahymena utriculariae]